MKPRTILTFLFLVLVLIVWLSYTRISLHKASAPPEPPRAPSLSESPVRVYGRVEPLGREVFVGPQQSRRVTRIFVKEGQGVKAGQVLCELESDIERQSLRVAGARAEELARRLDLALDDLSRKEKLLASDAIAEFDVSQKRLEVKLLRQQLATAKEEVELRKRELATLTLRSPIEGLVYKFDVRVGEQLTPQDYERIVLGKQEKQVRVYIESFWTDNVHVGDRLIIRDSETLAVLGEGRVTAISPYVGTRDFRTEDALERLDTKYAQAILRMEGIREIPIGKMVLCERPKSGK